MEPIVETPRLTLRHFAAADAEAMMRILGDPEVMRYSTTGVCDLDWVRGWIGRRIESYESRGYGLWAVAMKGARDDQLIGYCGLTYFPDINGRAEVEVGYRLARAHWGCGYATEAARAVRDYAFQKLGLTRLISLIDARNLASIRVAEKLGMQHDSDVTLDGYTHPDRVYVIAR